MAIDTLATVDEVRAPSWKRLGTMREAVLIEIILAL